MKTKEFIKKTGLLFLLCTVLTANVGERSAYSDATQNELLLQDALRISEAMPSNKEYLYDEDGDSSDWLELVNIGTDPISLENCWLSDNGKKLWKWQLPAVSLNAGERLVVFCSGKDRNARFFVLIKCPCQTISGKSSFTSDSRCLMKSSSLCASGE